MSHRSPSPSASLRKRVGHADEDAARLVTRDCTLPAAVLPCGAVRPQILASPHAFAATLGGSVACLCGSNVVECHSDGTQHIYSGSRSRAFRCCALSSDGRFLAAGEAGTGRGPLVLVFDRTRGGPPTPLRGHHNGVGLLAWNSSASHLVSIGDADSDQSDHQMFLWSWPQAERLATSLCSRGITAVAFAPDANLFATVSAGTAKRWSIVQPQDAFSLAQRSRGPPTLVGKTLATVRQATEDDGFVATVWGVDSLLYAVTRRGLLGVVRGDRTAPADAAAHWEGVGQGACALVWRKTLCGVSSSGSGEFGSSGVLACAFVSGTVQIFDAGSLQPLLNLSAYAGAPRAIGLSCSLDGEALWVLYTDRSLARWQDLEDGPDKILPAPMANLRDVRSIPATGPAQVVTATDRGLQLWMSTPHGFSLGSRVEPGGPGANEISAIACASSLVACGHRGGEISLLGLPSFSALDPLPTRHRGDVLSLCFGPLSGGFQKGGPILLASASRDRSAMLFRVELCFGTGTGGAETDPKTSQTTLLLRLPGHSSAVQGVAVVGGADASGAQLAVCTADKILMLRDLCLSPASASVRRSHQHLGRGMRWLGLCAHPSKSIFYTACGDRRIMQLSGLGQVQQMSRISGSEVELIGPLRLSGDAKVLAVGLGGSEPGVMLIDTSNGMRPFSRLLGPADPFAGVAFIGENRLLGCAPDGAMLLWPVRPGQDHCDRLLPDTHTAATVDVRSGNDPRRAGTPRGADERFSGIPPADRFRSPQHPGLSRSCSAAAAGTDGVLERLMASSPEPPRWAATGSGADQRRGGDQKVHDNTPKRNLPQCSPRRAGSWGGQGSAATSSRIATSSAAATSPRATAARVTERPREQRPRERSPAVVAGRPVSVGAVVAVPVPVFAPVCVSETDSSTESGESRVLLGRWGRASKVGAQVRSASELGAVLGETSSMIETSSIGDTSSICGTTVLSSSASVGHFNGITPQFISHHAPPHDAPPQCSVHSMVAARSISTPSLSILSAQHKAPPTVCKQRETQKETTAIKDEGTNLMSERPPMPFHAGACDNSKRKLSESSMTSAASSGGNARKSDCFRPLVSAPMSRPASARFLRTLPLPPPPSFPPPGDEENTPPTPALPSKALPFGTVPGKGQGFGRSESTPSIVACVSHIPLSEISSAEQFNCRNAEQSRLADCKTKLCTSGTVSARTLEVSPLPNASCAVATDPDPIGTREALLVSEPSALQLRADVRRLCGDAVRTLQPGPVAIEVSMLLRRVDAVLQRETPRGTPRGEEGHEA